MVTKPSNLWTIPFTSPAFTEHRLAERWEKSEYRGSALAWSGLAWETRPAGNESPETAMQRIDAHPLQFPPHCRMEVVQCSS